MYDISNSFVSDTKTVNDEQIISNALIISVRLKVDWDRLGQTITCTTRLVK